MVDVEDEAEPRHAASARPQRTATGRRDGSTLSKGKPPKAANDLKRKTRVAPGTPCSHVGGSGKYGQAVTDPYESKGWGHGGNGFVGKMCWKDIG